MQLISTKSKLLLTLIYTLAIVATIVVICAPTDAPEASELERTNTHAQSSEATSADESDAHQQHSAHQSSKAIRELDYEYYYKFRRVVSEGVGKALGDCRQKFKWDRWNCPLKSFQGIMSQDEDSSPMPPNKELGLTRALISAGIVLSIVRSCSVGTNSLCSCSNPIIMPEKSAELFLASGAVTNAVSPAQVNHMIDGLSFRSASAPAATTFDSPTAPTITDNNREDLSSPVGHQYGAHHHHHQLSHHLSASRSTRDTDLGSEPAHNHNFMSPVQSIGPGASNFGFANRNENKFEWAGCDEVVKLGFRVAKAYLKSSDKLPGSEASQRINAHNFEAGRQAVKRTMKRRCKCQGTSGACQMRTCWTVLPDMSEVGDYLKRQYRVAAKVGATTAKETDATSLAKELSSIGTDKLVFADASPDYCYENKQLGINGTLGRYCSRTKHRNGTEVSRSERDSCDRLCTKCGYKIKREEISKTVQCDCRFKYCCSVECKRCPVVEETFKCIRHS